MFPKEAAGPIVARSWDMVSTAEYANADSVTGLQIHCNCAVGFSAF